MAKKIPGPLGHHIGGQKPGSDIIQHGYQPINPNSGHQPSTTITTRPPNTGSAISPAAQKK